MLNFERDVHGEKWGPSLSHPNQPDQLRPLGIGNVQIKTCGNKILILVDQILKVRYKTVLSHVVSTDVA